MSRGKASLVIDLQGPFELHAKLLDKGSSRPFVAASLWPDVSIFVTSEEEADSIINLMNHAKQLLRSVTL